MIDIHTHILPYVDDGAENFDEAYDMAVMAVRCGIRALVSTPHSNHDVGFKNYESEQLRSLFGKLKNILKDERVPLQIFRGMEVWTSTDIVDRLARKELLTLNGTRYVLIEFAFDEEIWWIEAVLRELLEAGYLPIIAHPERYYSVQEHPNLLYEWRKQGAFAQMNKGSLFGRFGKGAEYAANILLRHNLFNCIASDAHHSYIRTTDMTELKRYMDRHYSIEQRVLLLEQNPRLILEGRTLRKVEKYSRID